MFHFSILDVQHIRHSRTRAIFLARETTPGIQYLTVISSSCHVYSSYYFTCHSNLFINYYDGYSRWVEDTVMYVPVLYSMVHILVKDYYHNTYSMVQYVCIKYHNTCTTNRLFIFVNNTIIVCYDMLLWTHYCASLQYIKIIP